MKTRRSDRAALGITFLLIFCFLCLHPIQSRAADNIIRIRTAEDLYNINYNLSGDYVLSNDIDLSSVTAPGGAYDFNGNGWAPIGGGGTYSLGKFTGTFDGCGHSISGMRINLVKGLADVTQYNIGLFADNAGVIKNLTVKNCDIRIALNENCSSLVGGIAAQNEGLIKNCSVSGTIINLYRPITVGGICGRSNNAVTERCVNYCTIQKTGGSYSSLVGGIVGSTYTENEKIQYCANLADLTLQKGGVVGGIAGNCAGIINDCYNAGNLSCTAEYDSQEILYGIGGNTVTNCYNFGMLSGYCDYPITELHSGNISINVSNCYYRNGTSTITQVGATPLSEEQMRSAKSFTSFDFSGIWGFESGSDYPYPVIRNEVDVVELTSLPDKLTYYTGDSIKTDGGKLKVYFMDGHSETINLTIDMLSGFDMSTPGRQNVTVSYINRTDSFQIVVAQRPELQSLMLTSLPDRTEFARGTYFDFTGCQVLAVYQNGLTETIDIDASMTTGGDITTTGEYVITYSLEGKTVTFTVNVVPVKMIGIEVSTPPSQVSYVLGEPFNASGMEVVGVYNNERREVLSDYTIGDMPAGLGQQEVAIYYDEFTAFVEVTIEQQDPIAIMVSKSPDKTQYVEGEVFDPTGMVVSCVYNSGYSEEIFDYTVSEFPSGTGKKNLTISYKNLTTKLTVTVIPRIVERIEITSLPDQTEYIEGETFDPSGLVVSAVYNDNTNKPVTDYKISTVNTSTPGVKNVIVTYDGCSASFKVTVIGKTLIRIVVEEPDKLEYLAGEAFDASGMVVTAVYDNGTSEVINNYSVDGFTGEVGEVLLTVTYSGKTAQFFVTVHEPSGNWVIVEEATCTTTGKQVQYCTDCGKQVLEEIIPLASHTEVIDEAVEATCTENGLSEGKHCSVCNTVLEEQTVIPALGHEWGEFTQKSPATCTEAEILEHVCAICGEIEETEGAEATGHINISVNGAKEPTCTEVGYTGETFCNDCETVISAGEEIPATGHTSEKVAGKAATCTETGLTEGEKCSVCGTILKAQKQIPAIGHAYGGWTTVKKPTYDAEGQEQRVCANDKTHIETRTVARLEKPEDTTPETEYVPTLDELEDTVTNQKSDKDPENSRFGALQAKVVKASDTTLQVQWKKVKGATKYIVYGNKCGKNNRLKKLKTVSGTSYKQKKLKKGTYYKYLVVAVKGNKAISTSKVVHATTNGKYGNAVKITVGKTNVTVKKGKTYQIKAKVQNNKKAKKHRDVAYESSNPKIAKVTANGMIKGLKKGTCYVYAYAQNGVMKKIKVTVK